MGIFTGELKKYLVLFAYRNPGDDSGGPRAKRFEEIMNSHRGNDNWIINVIGLIDPNNPDKNCGLDSCPRYYIAIINREVRVRLQQEGILDGLEELTFVNHRA